jgi:hypothetical protein
LSAEPGLVSLAAAARRDHRPGLAWVHAQELPGGLPVVAAPVSSEQAAGAVEVLLASPLAGLFDIPGAAGDGGPHDDAGSAGTPVVIADAGRLPARAGGSPGVARLLDAADVVLLVARDTAPGLVHAAARLDWLTSTAVRHPPGVSRAGGGFGVQVLLVGSGHGRRADRAGGGFDPDEVSAELGVPVAGALPFDAPTAAALAGAPTHRPATLARSRLLRAAAATAASLHASAATGPGASTPADSDPDGTGPAAVPGPVEGRHGGGPAAAVAGDRDWAGTWPG